jgi:hypothetical protein
MFSKIIGDLLVLNLDADVVAQVTYNNLHAMPFSIEIINYLIWHMNQCIPYEKAKQILVEGCKDSLLKHFKQVISEMADDRNSETGRVSAQGRQCAEYVLDSPKMVSGSSTPRKGPLGLSDSLLSPPKQASRSKSVGVQKPLKKVNPLKLMKSTSQPKELVVSFRDEKLITQTSVARDGEVVVRKPVAKKVKATSTSPLVDTKTSDTKASDAMDVKLDSKTSDNESIPDTLGAPGSPSAKSDSPGEPGFFTDEQGNVVVKKPSMADRVAKKPIFESTKAQGMKIVANRKQYNNMLEAAGLVNTLKGRTSDVDESQRIKLNATLFAVAIERFQREKVYTEEKIHEIVKEYATIIDSHVRNTFSMTAYNVITRSDNSMTIEPHLSEHKDGVVKSGWISYHAKSDRDPLGSVLYVQPMDRSKYCFGFNTQLEDWEVFIYADHERKHIPPSEICCVIWDTLPFNGRTSECRCCHNQKPNH